jgi:prolyl-tRNA editing enzyme YbaK/EbsC (Cys-tRNA(Pro) deacylase)
VPETDHPAHRRVREAARRKGVEIEILTFPESTHTAQDAAQAVGAELGQIVKSLVFAAPGDDGSLEPVVALVSGVNRVDIGLLAACVSEPNLRRASAEADAMTGFVIGGIPPIGEDPRPRGHGQIWAIPSSGRRPGPTAVFAVPPGTLRMLADAWSCRRVPAAIDVVEVSAPRRYPGGLAAFIGGQAAEGGCRLRPERSRGSLADHGSLPRGAERARCRAELVGGRSAPGPSGLADRPATGPALGRTGPLVVAGFMATRSSGGRASCAGATPRHAQRRRLGSSRLDTLVRARSGRRHRSDASVAWRAAHDEVVIEAEMVGGPVIVGFDGRARARSGHRPVIRYRPHHVDGLDDRPPAQSWWTSRVDPDESRP